MLTFAAHQFVALTADLANISGVVKAADVGTAGETRLSERARNTIKSVLADIRPRCIELGLQMSALGTERLERAALRQECTYREAGQECRILGERVIDELSLRCFLSLDQHEAALYQNPAPFGGEVTTPFPEAATDIDEAAKCLAVGRYTGCVFHLMRVMETGLNALAVRLGVPTHLPSWDAKLKKIEAVLDGLDRSSMPSGDWTFLQEARANLRSVQTAWRNPSMHVEKLYTEEIARDIFNAVRGFIRHLAAKLGGAAGGTTGAASASSGP